MDPTIVLEMQFSVPWIHFGTTDAAVHRGSPELQDIHRALQARRQALRRRVATNVGTRARARVLDRLLQQVRISIVQSPSLCYIHMDPLDGALHFPPPPTARLTNLPI